MKDKLMSAFRLFTALFIAVTVAVVIGVFGMEINSLMKNVNDETNHEPILEQPRYNYPESEPASDPRR